MTNQAGNSKMYAVGSLTSIAAKTTIVTACMNRETNLIKVIGSWIATDCQEILIVDWSCDVPLATTLKDHCINDSRIRIIRIEGESSWILTHAYNVGLRMCQTEYVLKLDNDHKITKAFFTENCMDDGLDARLGSWRMAKDVSQHYINGAFLARQKCLQRIGFFNELITSYGWDDSYLHESLFSSGARLGLIEPSTIEHIDQAHETRTSNQNIRTEDILSKSLGIKTTDFMNRRNMYLSGLLPRQGENAIASTYQESNHAVIENSGHIILRRASSPTKDLAGDYTSLATVLAYRDFFCWAEGLLPMSISLKEAASFHPLLQSAFSAEYQSTKKKQGSEKSTLARAKWKILKDSHNPLERLLNSKLRAILPTICHYYGHTNNDNFFVVNIEPLGLGAAEAEQINLLIPGWIKDKVKCGSYSKSAASGSKEIVEPIRDFTPIASRLLFQQKDDNQYFWAAYNSLPPHQKRSLYDLIESSGSPCDVIFSCLINYAATGGMDNNQIHAAINACQLASHFTSGSDYRTWLDRTCHRLALRYSSSIVSQMRSIALDTAIANTLPSQMTLSTSLFKGSEHLVDYCFNIRKMRLFKKTNVDIHLIPSSEATSQHDFLNSFFSEDPNVRIYRHSEDPGLYNCWNMSAKDCSTTFIGNANVDDRRGRYHSDYLIFMALMNGYDAVSSALLVDQVSSSSQYSSTQDVWFTGMGGPRCERDFIQVTETSVTSRNHMHCMPIWRRDLHDRVGFFDETEYGTSADWEFWLRAARSNAALNVVDIPLGFYLLDANSHNRRGAGERLAKERRILQRYFPGETENKGLRLT